jgi:hypothetical protein
MKQRSFLGFLLIASLTGTGCAAITPTSDDELDGDFVQNDTVEVVATSKNSFAPTPPEGSTCRGTDDTFTFKVATRELLWSTCRRQPGGTYNFAVGSRTLSQRDAAPIYTSLNSLEAPAKTSCAEDIGNTSIRIASPTGARDLVDAQNACNGRPGTYVQGIDDVLQAMRALSNIP